MTFHFLLSILDLFIYLSLTNQGGVAEAAVTEQPYIELATETHPVSGILRSPPSLWRTPFEEVSHELRRSVYGVEYAELQDTTGGRLWLTHTAGFTGSVWTPHTGF